MIWGVFLLVCSSLGIIAFFTFPLFLGLVAGYRTKSPPIPAPVPKLSVTILLAVRNGENLLEEKMANLLALDLPGPLQLLICSDGSSDGTEAYLRGFSSSNITIEATDHQCGKAWCLTQMLPKCTGDLLVFTDADAIFQRDAVLKLAGHFADKTIGGVCGQRVIRANDDEMVAPQKSYIGLDSWIKEQETKIGSISSNDGKLYAVRRQLACEFPGPVTDDLWQAMNIVRQGYRFIFEPSARVYIRTPARSLRHELSRRRRVVSTSLNGIWRARTLLNPFKYGFFSLGLLINKVDRRLLPFWLLGVLLGTARLSPYHPVFIILTAGQIAGYMAVLLYNVTPLNRILPKPFAKLAEKATYFLMGNLGMFLGTLDFLFGRTPSKWEPKKSN